MGRMYMSTKELDRLLIIEKVCKKKIKLNKAAKLLNISIRQAIRIKKTYQREGAKGLISKKVGKSGRVSRSQQWDLLTLPKIQGDILTHKV